MSARSDEMREMRKGTVRLARIGSCQLSALVSEGRLDLIMSSDLHLQKSIGITLMFDDLKTFETLIKKAIRATRSR